MNESNFLIEKTLNGGSALHGNGLRIKPFVSLVFAPILNKKIVRFGD